MCVNLVENVMMDGVLSPLLYNMLGTSCGRHKRYAGSRGADVRVGMRQKESV